MIDIDLSKFDVTKLLPIKKYADLVAFVPGLFFEISILLANPEMISRLVTNSQQGFVLGRYVWFGIALFLAFIGGNIFLLTDSLIQVLFSFVVRFQRFIWKQFCNWPARPFLDWLMRKPGWTKPWLANLNRYVTFVAYFGSDEWKAVQGCWGVLARTLLVRYGVNPKELKDDEWEPLYWNLGALTREDIQGNILLIMCHATGWAGLLASRISPGLRNWYYITFCMFAILNGLIHAYTVAYHLYNPQTAGYMNIRAVLRELRKISSGKALPTLAGGSNEIDKL